MRLNLPFPPSINHYWRHARGRTYISGEGVDYRSTVVGMLADTASAGEGRLAVSIDAHPPDRRRRDLDNIQKPLLDALAHAGAYVDDSQIDWLLTRRRIVATGGRVAVNIWPLDHAADRCPYCEKKRDEPMGVIQ